MEECDGDLEGAFLGTLIGGGAGLLVGGLATSFQCPDGECYAFLLMPVGAFAGFWGGLAYDSQTCELP